MKILNKILFPTDFGSTAHKDLEHAIKIAEKFESELVLLHVLPNYPMWDPFIVKIRQKVDEKMLEFGQFIENYSDIKHKVKLDFGQSADKIVEIAHEENVNVILLGPGNQKQDKHPLGGNTEKIIRASSIPVWVMDRDNPFNMETILCPVDLSPSSARALDNAIHLTRRFEAKLIVLHVIQPIDEIYSNMDVNLELERENYERASTHKFEEFLKSFNLSELDWQQKIKEGKPNEVIDKVIHDDVIDLLIMGTHGRKGVQRFFMGSVTEKVIKDVPCSFITVKTQDFIKLELDDELKDIQQVFENAVKLAKDGYYDEALKALDRCLEMNEYNVKAWHARADIYEKMGDAKKSQYCNDMADKVQRTIWDKKVEADLRGRHSIFS